jgi:hypothetical protein
MKLTADFHWLGAHVSALPILTDVMLAGEGAPVPKKQQPIIKLMAM